jgi:hypothetical protein
MDGFKGGQVLRREDWSFAKREIARNDECHNIKGPGRLIVILIQMEK